MRNTRRFDLNLPEKIAEAIEKMAKEKTIPPRILGRSLLVQKVREVCGHVGDMQGKSG